MRSKNKAVAFSFFYQGKPKFEESISNWQISSASGETYSSVRCTVNSTSVHSVLRLIPRLKADASWCWPPTSLKPV
ncbi:hypothetical protein D3C85_1125830 [compost metagenome]